MDNKYVSPPYANRGATNTCKVDLIALVDWVSVTLSFCTVDLVVDYLDELGATDFVIGAGRYNYDYLYSCPHGINLYFSDSSDHMHLEITGSGCRYLEKNNDGFDWVSFFVGLSDLVGYDYIKCTRLDLAYDDFRGFFTITEVIRKLKNNEVVSRLRSSIVVESYEINDVTSKGKTVYFGSNKSDLQIRMYEKHHEMSQKNIDHDKKIWNRTEVQLRRNKANNVFVLLRDNKYSLQDISMSIINDYISIRTKSNDSNRSRWPIWYKWRKFIIAINKVDLSTAKYENSLQKTIDWANDNMYRVMAMIHQADPEKFKQIIQKGIDNLKLDDIIMINDYKNEIKKSATRAQEDTK